MSDFPLVSIITPSYNQDKFVLDTIRSVFQQDYPNIEHIVVDGASTDNTPEILKSYSALNGRFRYVSEPDRGQSHAINKGLAMASGDMIGWLNSDDMYTPDAVSKAVNALIRHPEWAMVYGSTYAIDEHGKLLAEQEAVPFGNRTIYHKCYIGQPSAFLRKSALREVGGIDESLQFCMDYELWMRISLSGYKIGTIRDYLAYVRYHAATKSSTRFVDTGLPEVFRSQKKLYGQIANYWVMHYIYSYFEKGPLWLTNKFKEYGIFGDCPRIVRANLYEDSWTPARYQITVRSDPSAPADRLILAGKHAVPDLLNKPLHLHCTVYVDGVEKQKYEIFKGAFVLDIPIDAGRPECKVEVAVEDPFIPKDPAGKGTTAAFGFIAEETVAMSSTEYAFYQVLRDDPSSLWDWLRENRNDIPQIWR